METLLGFDAREAWLSPGQAWPPDRRRLFLLREDVEKPLSTDTRVWPSALGPGLPEPEARRLSPVLDMLPLFRGPYQDLWQELGAVTEHVRRLPTSASSWIVAVSGESGSDREGDGWEQNATPSVRDPQWALLGYDVSDKWLLSGLSNCGYGDEGPALRQAWAPKLNQHHLFSSLDDALAFRQVSDGRVREHAPFAVYGLWLIAR